jgi:hypothetical protein
MKTKNFHKLYERGTRNQEFFQVFGKNGRRAYSVRNGRAEIARRRIAEAQVMSGLVGR